MSSMCDHMQQSSPDFAAPEGIPSKFKRISRSHSSLLYYAYPALFQGLFSVTYRWLKSSFADQHFT